MANKYILTIGSFDGVHLGHQALLKKTVEEARRRRLRPVALTFDVPPRMILERKKKFSLLTSPLEKKYLLFQNKMDRVETLPFDSAFSKRSPFVFFRDVLLKKFKAKGIVVGLDFRFGVNRSGGARELVRWGGEYEIPVWVISPIKSKGRVVSSTHIRSAIGSNQFGAVKNDLGAPFVIYGEVVRGRGQGHTLGFPTANLKVPSSKLLPLGVYAVRARAVHPGRPWKQKGPWMKGVCNIGRRPTLLKRSKVVPEVHLFGNKGSGKNKAMVVELWARLRSEKRFSSKAALIRAIKGDISKARRFFKANHFFTGGAKYSNI